MNDMKSNIGFGFVLTVLVLLGLVTSYPCPHDCKCEPSGYDVSVTCGVPDLNYNYRSFNLSLLPPQNTTSLTIICNRLSLLRSSLKPRMFEKLYRLEQIVIYGCHIDFIDEDVFAGVSNLKNLSIFYAQRLSIHQKTFLHIPNLEILKIIDCDLQGLSPNSLCVLSKIRTLHLSGGQIGNISELLCFCSHNFSELMYLTLKSNRIQILKSDLNQKLRNLKMLVIRENRIELIENGTLSNLNQLRYLDISHNNLTQLPDDFLSGCPQVHTLMISNNPLTKLPPVIRQMKNLYKFYANNTLITDISLLEQTTLIVLWMNNCNLTTIPPRLCGQNSDLNLLDLGQNSISKVPPNIFKNCANLELLDLSMNNISTLFNDSFKGLERLLMLALSQNNISSWGKNIFLNMPNLLKLNLSSNSMAEIPLIPEELDTLDLNNNKIRRISKKYFSHYRSFDLKYLFLVNNSIEEIEDGAFQVLYKLFMMNLKMNNLTELNRNAFGDLKNLIGLNVAYNKITNINLNELISLRYFFAQHNLISRLDPYSFPVSVSIIDLQFNQIKTVEYYTFEKSINLQKVDLRMNRIWTLDFLSVKLPSSNGVSNFYISGNSFECGCELGWLKELSERKLPPLGGNYPAFQDLNILMCFQHGKHWLPVGAFRKIEANRFLCKYERSSYLKLPYSCDTLCGCCLQENCYCQDTCPENCLCMLSYNRNINTVNCTHGNLTDGTGVPSNATMIDLSGNNLGDLSSKTFIKQTKVTIFYLNHSRITEIGEKTFVTFNLLEVLHLEYNEIRMLNSGSFLGLPYLKVLILNHNGIEMILSGTFRVTPRLEVLDLSHNNLRQIDSQTFNENSLKTIFLFKNPWSCDCEDLNSLRDILLSQSSEINSLTLLCNQSQIPVLQYDTDFCRNQSLNSTIQMLHMQDTELVYGLSIGLTLTVALFIVGTLLYMYRNEIQILFFVRFGWRILSKKNRLDEEDKEFDAFVSFHNSQDDFVVYEMLPHLEHTNPAYKLCVHFRDFAVGAAIVDNITESIENSKRTIILLNNQFLESEWCKYEFQAAHFDALSNKLSSLILVLLEDVNTDLLYGGLKLYMKTKTYLRYDDPRFWDKLRFALPEKKEEKIINEDKDLKDKNYLNKPN